MTSITIKLSEGKSILTPSKVLMDLAGHCGTSLTQLKQSAGTGNPILNVELFMNDHIEIAQKIRGIMTLDRENDLELAYFETQNGGVPDDSEKIDPEIIETALREADGEFL